MDRDVLIEDPGRLTVRCMYTAHGCQPEPVSFRADP